jgi:hypothetical protein
MILKSHRGWAKQVRADVDASELFGFSVDADSQIAADIKRWGVGHARYAKIRKSLRALIRELSLKLDPENDMGIRA